MKLGPKLATHFTAEIFRQVLQTVQQRTPADMEPMETVDVTGPTGDMPNLPLTSARIVFLSHFAKDCTKKLTN